MPREVSLGDMDLNSKFGFGALKPLVPILCHMPTKENRTSSDVELYPDL